MSWTSWATASSDGETDRVTVSGSVIWEEKVTGYNKKKNQCEQTGWELADPQFPKPAGRPDARTCYKKLSKTFPCSGTMLVTFSSETDKAVTNEQWSFNDFRISIDSRCEPVTVRVGNSGTNTKRVKVPGVQSCARNAGHPGVRTNLDYQNAPDRFTIIYNAGQVSAKRLDADHGWGMQLEIECCAAVRMEVSAG